MKKQTVKPDSVTQPVFDLAIEVRDWLSSFGQGATVLTNPDNDQQMFVVPEFSQTDMLDAGIDVYNMPDVVGAWSDWNDENTIIVGPQGFYGLGDEPMNEDDHTDMSTIHLQPLRPLDLDI